MSKYKYSGPVMMFGRCIANSWEGETCAISESKAKSNLAYQFKRKNNLAAGAASISFPSKLRIVG